MNFINVSQNVKFLILFCFTSVFIGFVTLFAFTPITSIVVKYYEDIKGKYDIDKSHLASINTNGIWIREKAQNSLNIIKSQRLEGEFLIGVSIYKFDKNNSLILPLIMLKRTSIGKNTLSTQGFEHDVQQKYAKVTRNSKCSKDNRYDRFAVQVGKKPVMEQMITSMPDFSDITYEFMLFADIIHYAIYHPKAFPSVALICLNIYIHLTYS